MPRILLDHNCPRGVRDLLTGHEVRTAASMGWAALTNGHLLALAESHGFDALMTGDRNMRHQQNLAGRRIALVVLPTNYWPTVRQHGEAIARAVDQAAPGSYAEVEFDVPRRPARRPKEPGP